MKIYRLARATLVVFVTISGMVFAAEPASAPQLSTRVLTPVEQQLKKTVEDRMKVEVDEITPLPFINMYELRFGSKVIYSDAKGDYVFVGNLIDLKAQVNLTAERTDALEEASLPKLRFADLPFASAIKITKGTGKRQLAVFEDPNCGFCKRLEHDLQSVNDVTIYIFLYPVLGDDSVAKAKNIWCAKDPAKTWDDWMASGAPIANPSACSSTPIDQNLALGDKLKVTGTPTLFFQSGKRVPGAIPLTEINKLLAPG